MVHDTTSGDVQAHTRDVEAVTGTDEIGMPMRDHFDTAKAREELSPFTSLLKKLQQLRFIDPNRVSEIAEDIAYQLNRLAEKDDDQEVVEFLTELARKFQKVANGSELSVLKLPDPLPGSRAYRKAGE